MGFGSILSLGRGRGNRESPTNAFISAFMAGKRLKLAQDEEERGKRLDELTEERLKLQLQEIKQRQKFAQNEQERATLESQRQDAIENIALLEGRPGPSMADVLTRNQIPVPSGPLTPEIQISPKEFRSIQTPHEPIQVPQGPLVQPRTEQEVEEIQGRESIRGIQKTFFTEAAKQQARQAFGEPPSPTEQDLAFSLFAKRTGKKVGELSGAEQAQAVIQFSKEKGRGGTLFERLMDDPMLAAQYPQFLRDSALARAGISEPQIEAFVNQISAGNLKSFSEIPLPARGIVAERVNQQGLLFVDVNDKKALQKLSQAESLVDQLQEFSRKVAKNPLDVESAFVLNGIRQATAGVFAKGVFAEVGVLTDKDIARVQALIPGVIRSAFLPNVAEAQFKELRNIVGKARVGLRERGLTDTTIKEEEALTPTHRFNPETGQLETIR